MRVSTKVDTCIYLTRSDRPDCEGAAVVAYGSALLCASCDSRRSTLGKGIAARRPKPTSFEPLEGLSVAQDQLDQASQNLVGWVALARETGCSWERIAQVLRTTRQGAQQRYGTGISNNLRY
jgi:hypothetical protein